MQGVYHPLLDWVYLMVVVLMTTVPFRPFAPGRPEAVRPGPQLAAKSCRFDRATRLFVDQGSVYLAFYASSRSLCLRARIFSCLAK